MMTKNEMIQAARDWDGRDVCDMQNLIESVLDLIKTEAKGDSDEADIILNHGWGLDFFEVLSAQNRVDYPVDISEGINWVAIDPDGWALRIGGDAGWTAVRRVHVGIDEGETTE